MNNFWPAYETPLRILSFLFKPWWFRIDFFAFPQILEISNLTADSEFSRGRHLPQKWSVNLFMSTKFSWKLNRDWERTPKILLCRPVTGLLWFTNNLVFHSISRVAHNNWIGTGYTPLQRAQDHFQWTVLVHLGYTNSCCNFFLYILTGPSFRKQFIETFTFCKKRNYIRDHNWISPSEPKVFLVPSKCLTAQDLQGHCPS